MSEIQSGDIHFWPSISVLVFIIARIRRVARAVLDTHIFPDHPPRHVHVFDKDGKIITRLNLDTKLPLAQATHDEDQSRRFPGRLYAQAMWHRDVYDRLLRGGRRRVPALRMHRGSS